MKRGVIVVLIVVVVGGALAAGWWWARTYPDQATQFLVSGGLEASRAEAFIALVGGQARPEEEQILVASGSIEGEEVAVVSEFGGQIIKMHVDEGDEVESRQVVVELDASLLRAEMAQAEAAVSAAEANLRAVEAGTHPAEILAARAMVQQAIAERDAARTAWEDAQVLLDNPQEIDAQITQAKAAVDLATAKIEQAQAQLAAAEEERDQYRAQGSMEEKWLYRVHDYQVEAAKAAIDAAEAEKDGAKETLAAQRALRASPLILISQVNLAKSQYEIAEAGLAVAEAKLTELEAGPRPEEVAVAKAQVAQAQAAISGLQVRIDKTVLQAPMAGMVTSRSAHAGEAAIAGATLLTIANLDEVTLTIYVPEDELNRVYLGQEVQVQVDSFPDRPFAGVVSYISQQAEFTPKNVQTEKERVNMVFAVKVRLANPGHLLKPGMPADAIIR